MRPPRVPDNEADRLEALQSYDILDAARDEAFDALVRVASSICEVPIAVVTLVDDRRQWFLASVGLDGLTEIPREISFCAHAISGPEMLVVEDLERDERFAENPLVVGAPNVRFYAGCPLVDKEGFALGTLCVLDRQPRTLAAHQMNVLRQLSTAMVRLLEARRVDDALFAAELAAKRARADLVEALVTSERRNELLQLAEELAGVGHWRVEIGRRELYVSQRIFEILGWDPATFVPTLEKGLEAYHPDDREQVRDHIFRAMEQREPFACELRVIRTDGQVRLVNAHGRCEVDPVTDKPRAVVGIFRDVTELEALRTTMLRQDRLVTTGTLAAGVGHEINNPLTYVGANLEYALDALRTLNEAAPSEKIAELLDVLDEARDGAERIGKIVRGLRAFARENAPLVRVDVHAALEIATNMAVHELRSRATVTKAFGELPFVLGDESRLSQVFVNLLVNAAQAFPTADADGNRITVRTSRVDDKLVAIEVDDNGPGIPPHVLERIFDPFFTTRAIGEGAGLGLSISHSIVTSLGGDITCTSTVGKGTCFRVVLPAARGPSAEIELRPPVSSPAAGARVLVVDDEESVLRAIARLLRPENDVVAVSDPREALRLLESGERFDVILCDLMMPQLSGMDLYRLVLDRSPATAQRFVFITGGTTHEEVRGFLAQVPNERLEKPFSKGTLRDMARRFAGPRQPAG